jgi:hypothetical protein
MSVLALTAAAFAADNLALWPKYKTVTINTKASGASVPGSVGKFPVLVRLDSVNASEVFAQSQANGADIRFGNAAGTAAAAFEIEHWDASKKKAAIWVLADTVKGNDSVAAFRLYWGRPDVGGAVSAPVFETSNGYVGAWHFGNGTGDVRPGSVAGSPAAYINNGAGATKIPGVIGMADTLRHITGESSDPAGGTWIDLTHTAGGAPLSAPYSGYNDFTAGISYSLWARPQGVSKFWRMLVLAPEDAVTAGDRILFMGSAASDVDVAVRWTSGCGYVAGANPCNIDSSLVLDQWNHIFVTKAVGNTPVQFYVNGVLRGSSSSVNNASAVDRNIAWIGRAGDNNPFFTGTIDNATLAKATRSADFIKLSYQTQKAGANAVALGATQAQTVTAVAISGLAYTAQSADTVNVLVGKPVNVLPAFNGGPVDSFKVVSGTLPAGLTVAKSNGALSGTATAALAAGNVVIKAWGHASANDTLSRTVRIAAIAPATLTYTPDSLTYNINTAITAATPAYTGATPTYSVSPALPAGLTLNASTGVISGTPTAAVARASYTVKAKTFIDSATKVLRIAVINPNAIQGGALAAFGFSAKPSAQGIVFRMNTASGEKAVLNLVDVWGRTVYTGSFKGGMLSWNGTGSKGESVSSGLYVARVNVLDAQGRKVKGLEHKVVFTR